jgi:hypothetical protein
MIDLADTDDIPLPPERVDLFEEGPVVAGVGGC